MSLMTRELSSLNCGILNTKQVLEQKIKIDSFFVAKDKRTLGLAL